MLRRTLTLFFLSALTLSSAALAQALAAGATVFTTEAVELKRFPDAVVSLTTLDPGAKVEVMLVDGPLARVRRGVDMGWVPVGKLGATPPAPAMVTEVPVVPAAPVTPTMTTP